MKSCFRRRSRGRTFFGCLRSQTIVTPRGRRACAGSRGSGGSGPSSTGSSSRSSWATTAPCGFQNFLKKYLPHCEKVSEPYIIHTRQLRRLRNAGELFWSSGPLKCMRASRPVWGLSSRCYFFDRCAWQRRHDRWSERQPYTQGRRLRRWHF